MGVPAKKRRAALSIRRVDLPARPGRRRRISPTLREQEVVNTGRFFLPIGRAPDCPIGERRRDTIANILSFRLVSAPSLSP